MEYVSINFNLHKQNLLFKIFSAPEKPQRIAFQILAPTSLQVNWGEPPETNGQIVQYQIQYGFVDQNEILANGDGELKIIELPSGHQRSVLLEELRPDIEYLYAVRAKNEWGWGPFRKARLAIQMKGSRPPSDYVMGDASKSYESSEYSSIQATPALKRADIKVSARDVEVDDEPMGVVNINAPMFGGERTETHVYQPEQAFHPYTNSFDAAGNQINRGQRVRQTVTEESTTIVGQPKVETSDYYSKMKQREENLFGTTLCG